MRLRSVVTNVPESVISAIPSVTLIKRTEDHIVVETPRYRAFTGFVQSIINSNGRFVEIAGNDEIMVSLTGADPRQPVELTGGVIISQFGRDSYADDRLLVSVRVDKLADLAAEAGQRGLILEHICDY